MLPGYADVHVKGPITQGLRLRGMDVVTAQERGQDQEPDEVLLETATQEGRLILTNDKDFLKIHYDWMLAGKSHAGIVYWEQTMAIGGAVRKIIYYAQNTPPDQAANAVKYL
jgi:hypothetical protein